MIEAARWRLTARASTAIPLLGAVIALGALIALGLRALVHLDSGFDALWYHLPFAALRTGIAVPYDIQGGQSWLYFQGFPPLADIVQGLLWRASGMITAAQLANLLAFVVFVAYCHRYLRAPFWLVTLIALTAPLVLIHATTAYVDLFGNAWLAIGASSCMFLYLFPDRASRAVVIGGLAGLAAACWTKQLLVPVATLLFLLYLPVAVRAGRGTRLSSRTTAGLVAVVVAIAFVPYLKNLLAYGDPMWPFRIPVVGGLFSYANDAVPGAAIAQRPPGLVHASQPEVFLRSLFEIDVPTRYVGRPRWVLDQWSAVPDGMRMGGFWNVAVAFYLTSMVAALIAVRRRTGAIAVAVAIGVLGFVAILPQSNELRYFMFIPLVWAATIGMLFPDLRRRWPRLAVGFVILVMALFGYMVGENLTYYQVQPYTWVDVAKERGAALLWPQLADGGGYCAVNMAPIAFLMTGPTRTEHMIYDRTSVADCPAGTIVVTMAGIQGQP